MAPKNRGKKTKSRKAPPSSTSVPPPPPTEPQAKAAKASIDVLADFDISSILRRLSLADLLRAALACHRWRRLAAACLPRAPPLLGYFFHPTETPPPPPLPYTKNVDTPAVFVPLDASSSRLSLDFAPDKMIPRFLVLDPSTRRRMVLPPPRRDTVPDDRRWRNSRYYVGSALLSRACPGKLCFEVVCFAIDGGHPRAWVASVDNGDCSWRALPRDEEVVVEFDPYWFEGRCVHAGGKIYWHICNSWRLLVLDPATLKFSCLLKQLQLWVRGEGRSSDNSWLLERRIVDLSVVCDMVPGLHRDTKLRTLRVWPSDMDAGRTGKVFIKTWGYGYYSFDMDTGKMERLSTKGGKEYGHPMFAYFLAWPPAFLAPEN
ncbi:hypothetical protein VPH35_097059 [Triticum aestivum]